MTRPALLLLGLLLTATLAANPAEAAPVFDGAAGVAGANTDSVSYNHTIISNTNGVLQVSVCAGTSLDRVTGVTYNSVAMTRVAYGTYSGGGRGHWIYRLLVPHTGTHAVVVSLSAVVQVTAHSISLTGVNQSTPTSDSKTATGTSTTPSVTMTTAGSSDLTVDRICWTGSGTITVGSGQTSRYEEETGSLRNVISTETGNVTIGLDDLVVSGLVHPGLQLPGTGGDRPLSPTRTPARPRDWRAMTVQRCPTCGHLCETSKPTPVEEGEMADGTEG